MLTLQAGLGEECKTIRRRGFGGGLHVVHAGKEWAPALTVRSGRLQAGVICRLVPRQMARSALLACLSASFNSAGGSASSLSTAPCSQPSSEVHIVTVHHASEISRDWNAA